MGWAPRRRQRRPHIKRVAFATGNTLPRLWPLLSFILRTSNIPSSFLFLVGYTCETIQWSKRGVCNGRVPFVLYFVAYSLFLLCVMSLRDITVYSCQLWSKYRPELNHYMY